MRFFFFSCLLVWFGGLVEVSKAHTLFNSLWPSSPISSVSLDTSCESVAPPAAHSNLGLGQPPFNRRENTPTPSLLQQTEMDCGMVGLTEGESQMWVYEASPYVDIVINILRLDPFINSKKDEYQGQWFSSVFRLAPVENSVPPCRSHHLLSLFSPDLWPFSSVWQWPCRAWAESAQDPRSPRLLSPPALLHHLGFHLWASARSHLYLVGKNLLFHTPGSESDQWKSSSWWFQTHTVS